jgi:chaperonin GroES
VRPVLLPLLSLEVESHQPRPRMSPVLPLCAILGSHAHRLKSSELIATSDCCQRAIDFVSRWAQMYWHSCALSANWRRPWGAEISFERLPMKFRPLHDRVVIRRLTAEEKTAGGIIIPDTVKEKPSEGEVVAVGPGARNDKGDVVPLDLSPGDRVLFGKWSGTEVKIDGEELIIMNGSDIMGIVESGVAKKKAA